MASQKLSDLKEELTNLQAQITPEIEGLNDFARLNLQSGTIAIIKASITDFGRRNNLMANAIKALDDLAKDGYPDNPAKQVIQAVYADLQENLKTLNAAFAKFAPVDEAVSATIVPGTPVTIRPAHPDTQ